MMAEPPIVAEPPAPAAPPPAPSRPPQRGPTTPQYILGLFVLWQLFFLVASNFIGMVQSVQKHTSYIPKDWKKKIDRHASWFFNENSHFNDALKAVDGITDRWAYLTCQPQGWSLFAPNVGREITFVAVEMRWDDHDPWARPAPAGAEMPYAPELLLSENEPRDPTHFFRWGKFRLRKYESYLDVSLTVDSKDPAEVASDWEEQIKKRLTYNQDRRWDNIHAYFLSRFRDFRETHPNRPMPRQFILHVRRYDIPRPSEFSLSWYRPDSLPICRWKPGNAGDQPPSEPDDTEPVSPYYQMERYVPSVYDVLCSDIPDLRKNASPEVLAFIGYWSQAGLPFGFVSAGAYQRTFAPGHFVKLD
jgi:hypothetical protein